jgi:hypothetical protein
MKTFSVHLVTHLAAAALLAVALAPPALAADSEFNGLVSSIERRYQVRREHIPLIGLVSFCAWVYTKGGVKGFRVADFENVDARVSADDLDSLVQEKLGASWNVILRSHRKDNRDDTIIYARSAGDKFQVLIAEIENNELSLVRVRINANSLSRWVNDQERHGDE